MPPATAKLDLSLATITKVSGSSNGLELIDEQALAGDPKKGSGGSPVTPYSIDYTEDGFVYIDLGGQFVISDIYWYDATGNNTVTISEGRPDNWEILFVAPMNKYNQWQSNSTLFSSRYIGINYPKGFSGINEIVIYGTECVDDKAPNVPVGIKEYTKTHNTIQIEWNSATDNGCDESVSYDIFVDEVFNQNTVDTMATITGLETLTEYTIKIKAKDGAGNTSIFSDAVSITTTKELDLQPPSIPTNLRAENLTSESLTLLWNKSTDNKKMDSYVIYQDGSVLKSTSDTLCLITDLLPLTSYIFEVMAQDSAGNQSALSKEINITTLIGDLACEPQKMILTPEMVVNPSAKGDATLLVDEQIEAGNPKDSVGGVVTNTWGPGSPASAYVDFGTNAIISNLFLRDIEDHGKLNVYKGKPDNWSLLLTDNLTGYQSWNQHNLDTIVSRYLQFEMESASSKVVEIVVYGCIPGDHIPPGNIADLRVLNVTHNSASLIWTASGDDGHAGQGAMVDIRYSESEITNDNFDDATPISNPPLPSYAGIEEFYTIVGLKSNTNYYFALKTIDDAGNVSIASNSPSATTTAEVISDRYGITFDQFMGTNSFVDDPIEKQKCVGFF